MSCCDVGHQFGGRGQPGAGDAVAVAPAVPDKSAPDPVEVASRLGGIHAQVMSSAVQIVGIRTRSLAGSDLDDVLWNRRTLVKTWG
jgi:hypothetical protein